MAWSTLPGEFGKFGTDNTRTGPSKVCPGYKLPYRMVGPIHLDGGPSVQPQPGSMTGQLYPKWSLIIPDCGAVLWGREVSELGQAGPCPLRNLLGWRWHVKCQTQSHSSDGLARLQNHFPIYQPFPPLFCLLSQKPMR